MKDRLDFFLELGLGNDITSYRRGLKTEYFINHPDLLREVWQNTIFERPTFTRKVLASVAGAGLLSQEGDIHRKQRRMMQPAFHKDRLAGYLEVMVSHVEAMVLRWETLAVNGQETDLNLEMKRIALEIVTGSLFRQERTEDVYKVTNALERLLPKLDQDVLIHSVLPEKVPVWYVGRDRQDLLTIRRGLMSTVRTRRETGKPSTPPDLLDMLLETKDEDGSSLSNEDITAQALTLMSAGFETTANTLTWLWWLLHTYPESLQQLRAELAETLQGRAPTLADLPKLRYTDWVIKETQRFYPVAWISNRVCTKEVTLAGHTFSEGTVFMMSPYVTHRDERFFEQPLEFNPLRFERESFPKFAYLPFGAGVHQCIGNMFALWEMKVVLAVVAQRFKIEPRANFTPTTKLAVTFGMETFPAKVVRY
jgi:cytochrome P450